MNVFPTCLCLNSMENDFFFFKLRFCDLLVTHILKYTFRRLSNANSGEILLLWLDVKDKTKLSRKVREMTHGLIIDIEATLVFQSDPTWHQSDPKSTSSRRLVSKTTWLDLAKHNWLLVSSRLLIWCSYFQRSNLFTWSLFSIPFSKLAYSVDCSYAFQ